MAALESGGSFDRLVARQKQGHALERPFYVDPDIFERDMAALVLRQWLLVDHVSRIPKVGDYIAYGIAGESIIVVRSGADAVSAFYNVCRHRGSRICSQASGSVRKFACPYHAWVYDLEGRLVGAKGMPAGFDPAQWSLVKCAVRVFEGLVFVNLAGDEAEIDFDEIARNLRPFVAAHGMAHSRIAHTATYPTEGNWKLVIENFRECYHCAPAHPEYTSVEAHVRANIAQPGSYDRVTAEWREKFGRRGHVVGSVDSGSDGHPQPHQAFRRPIRKDWMTHSQDGKPLAPLLGGFREFDGGQTVIFFGPLSSIIGLNDHAILFRFTPVCPTHTEIVLTWMVDGKAVEGADYDVTRLKWLWDITTLQDAKIIANNQKGVNSRRYIPGPYSEREAETSAFTRWYLEQIAPSEPNVTKLRTARRAP